MMQALRSVAGIPARFLVLCIELYRNYVSPLRMPTCRFTPTCSEYAVDALRERGAIVGGVLAVVRLLKCAPWHPGGWDPVPPRRERRTDEHDRHTTSEQDPAADHHVAASGLDEQRST